MSDPIHDLENLKHGGIDVNPLPASEVRRRGTRLRRRNNALIAAGALAVALVVGTPIAVVAGGSNRSDDVPVAPSPTPTPDPTTDTSWKHRVPEGFDLTALPDGATFRFTARAGSVVDDLTLCGRPTFSTRSNDPVGPALDTRGAAYGEAGTDGNLGRTLALYQDDQVAAKALEAFRAGVHLCPEDPNGNGAPLVQAPVETDLPADESFVFTQQARMDKDLLGDLTVWQVARIGNALYVATDHTSAGGAQVVDAEVQRMASLSAPVLSDMCVFAAEPCDAGTPPDPAVSSAAIGEGAVSAIPADFPLDANIVAPEGPLDGPSARSAGVPALDLCGASVWPATDTVQRLAVTSTMPQYRESRELVTFARTDEASAALQRVADAVQGCQVVPGATAADDKLVDAQQVDPRADVGAADEVVTFSLTYREGLGGGIYQLARVGRAVYATYVEGEFARDSIGQAVTGLSGKTKSIVPLLCPWTEQGC